MSKTKYSKFVGTLRNFGFLFEFMGLQYFSLEAFGDDESSGRPSLIRGVYFIIILSLILCFAALYILLDYEEMLKQFLDQKITTYAVQNSMKFGMIFVIITSTTQSFFATKKIKQFYKNVELILEVMFVEFRMFIDFKKVCRVSKFILVGIISFFCLIHSVLFVQSESDRTYLLAVAIFPVIFLLTTIYKFTFYVVIVNYQLESLKKIIVNIFKSQPFKIGADCDDSVMSPKKIYSPSIVSRKLINAKKVYNMLYENASLVNDSMGLTILNLLIVLVISITSSGYVIFVLLVDGKEQKKIPDVETRDSS
ncbi:hypothetical protein ACKWTF_012063 [Chironomus riparius]